MELSVSPSQCGCCLPARKLSKPYTFGDFLEAWLIINSNFSLISLLKRIGGEGAENSNLLIMAWPV